MAKEICISSTPHETRLAILEDDQLAEIYYERENEYTLAGSIYNGRVTRVLPGMQSAFVDLGLERDAFLYVTDFIELEDQEDTDELERAAASGAAQPPREVRRGGSARGTRGRREDQQQEPRNTGNGAVAEDAPDSVEALPATQQAADSQSEIKSQDESGGGTERRWRGRRHRRGRASTPPSEGRAEAESTAETTSGKIGAPEIAPDIRAAANTEADSLETVSFASSTRNARGPAVPAPLLLPGESLSKYGGTPVSENSQASDKPVPRPASFAKPSTLVEAPLEWDGSGLLPGESLARLRPDKPLTASKQNAATEAQAAPVPLTDAPSAPAGMAAEPGALAPLAATENEDAKAAADLFPELDEDMPTDAVPEFDPEPESELMAASVVGEEAAHSWQEEPPAERLHETSASIGSGATAPEGEEDARPGSGHVAPFVFETDAPEADANASASHRIDPIPPSGFRLFGIGARKRKSEEPAAEPPAEAPSIATVSAFAPGSGPVEEELIEGEEFEAVPHHRHSSAKADEADFDDYEEETLAAQIHSGGLGEMLQEAHLDHKIQLTFDDKNGDEALETEEDEEEPASDAVTAPDQPRRERSGRGRQARGTPGHGNRRGPSRRSMQTTDLPVISDLLKPGQEILVQIAKEPIAKKGARITSHIALPGRFLVFMPTVTHVGVSRKIASDEERHRLKRILVSERGEASGGFIVRTAAEGATEEELRADLRFLINLWNEVKQRSEASKSPALIYHDLSLIERILRDQVSDNFSNIWVDSEADYERIVRFLNRFSPSLVRRVKLYTKETPLFEHFGIQDEISKALRSKVWLKSGGSIVINQTEALVAIDINTGKYVGKSARLEDTILKTNLDAVPEIVRQIRLRDLGGIIVIDFIDMDERRNRYKVMAALEEALKSDRAPTKVLQFNDFGLVAITRKRVKQSLERTLSVPCPTCQATGMVKSPATVANEIYIEMRKMRKHFEGPDVVLRVNPETVKVLKNNNARWLVEFEELTGKNLLVKSDPTLHPEQFDIQG